MGIDFACLALAIYFEARSEPVEGQIAVAQVVMNRVESPRFPDTICEVVYQPAQFTFYWDGKSDRPQEPAAWKEAERVATLVLFDGVRLGPLYDVLNYHATFAYPWWSAHLIPVTQISGHIFYQES